MHTGRCRIRGARSRAREGPGRGDRPVRARRRCRRSSRRARRRGHRRARGPRLARPRGASRSPTGTRSGRRSASSSPTRRSSSRSRTGSTSSSRVPNDPLFGEQWGLQNTGQNVAGTPGTADADIDAPAAWDIGTGDPATVIAIMDSGAALNHPDLAPQLWQNPGEVGGQRRRRRRQRLRRRRQRLRLRRRRPGPDRRRGPRHPRRPASRSPAATTVSASPGSPSEPR